MKTGSGQSGRRQDEATERLAPGGELPPRPALEAGAVLGGRYELGRVLGDGGTGRVFAAFDRALKERVALKVLRSDRAADRSWIRRLAREVKVARLIRHPNVCRVFDLGHEDGYWFVTMELGEGRTLGDLLRRGDETPGRSWQQRLAEARALCAGLAAIHAVGFIHRDVTPQNVLCMPDGRLVLADFGLAVAAQEPTTFLGGTPRYMAPEVVAGQRADQRSDVYQLGLLLREILFGADQRAEAPGVATPAEEELAALCAECLAQDPARRPATALQVAGRLAAAEAAKPRSGPARTWRRATRIARRPRFRLAAAGLVIAALGLQAGRLALRPSMCRGGAARVAEVWDAPKREAVRRVFIATDRPHAAETFATVAGIIDDHLRRWVGAYTDACEATQVRGEQSEEALDLRMWCLSENLDAARALTRVLGSADVTIVDNAVAAAGGLGDFGRCRDIQQLRLGVRAPKDPMVREAARKLREKVSEARSLRDAGAYVKSLEIARTVVSESERIGYLPTLAEGLTVAGLSLTELGEPSASSTLDRAAYVAESCGDDRTFAEVAGAFIYRTSFFDPPSAERWATLADAALRRIGGDPRLDSWRLNNLGVLRYIEGRVDSAYDALQQSVALKVSSLGPANLDVAIGIKNSAFMLLTLGRPNDALAKIDESISIMRRSLPDHHPLLAEAEGDRAEALSRLGRYDEAKVTYHRTLRSFTEQLPPTAGLIAEPLNGLGRIALKESKFNDALEFLQRADLICAADLCLPTIAAEARFNLARVLDKLQGDLSRARALARQALHTYPPGPYFAAQRSEIDSWLASHAERPLPRAARRRRPARA